MPSLTEMRDQMLKAGRYFRRGLDEQGKKVIVVHLSDESGSLLVAVAAHDEAAHLAELIRDDGRLRIEEVTFEGERRPVEPARTFEPGVETRLNTGNELDNITIVLTALYHEPGEKSYGKQGHVHLHLPVGRDFKIGRRARRGGECLCAKKRGSRERPPTADETTMCPECVEVAAREGLEIPG